MISWIGWSTRIRINLLYLTRRKNYCYNNNNIRFYFLLERSALHRYYRSNIVIMSGSGNDYEFSRSNIEEDDNDDNIVDHDRSNVSVNDIGSFQETSDVDAISTKNKSVAAATAGADIGTSADTNQSAHISPSSSLSSATLVKPASSEPTAAIIATLANTATSTDQQSESLELQLNSVVKVFCVSTCPHYSQPWQMKRQSSSSSSGFVISGRRILTNAHGVTNASSIRIRKHGDATKYNASVICIGHDCDLALLTVSADKFWDGLEHLEFGDVPRLQDSVVVMGFPTGGDNLSVTKGVVSRVVVSIYSHSGESLLTIQIDAAINPGNSGGPAMQGSKVIGVAFEALSNAQSIGYIIPVPIIQHFLTDVSKHTIYSGFPHLGFSWQKCENESLRKWLRTPDDQHGIMISSIEPLTDLNKQLKKNDLLLAIDDIPISSDGTIFYRRGERVLFRVLEAAKFVGEKCKLSIIRQGERMEVIVTLHIRLSLVPLHLHDKRPSYYVHTGGIVFTPLSRAYLHHEYGREWHKKSPVGLVDKAYYGILESEGQEVVVASQVLVDDVNNSYNSSFHNLITLSVNDIPIHNLAHLVEIIESNNEEFLRIRLERDKLIVLEVKESDKAAARILLQNNIQHDRSQDLMEIKNKKKEERNNNNNKNNNNTNEESNLVISTLQENGN